MRCRTSPPPASSAASMIILGEDYGEGASVIQERSYAYAMKSSMWLLDPRPDLPTIVRMVEEGFELSEASHAPVMMELRIRACHVTGEFKPRTIAAPPISGKNRIAGPPRFQYGRLAHPPVIFSQERLKVEERLPAAQKFIREHKLNEIIPGDLDDVGIVVHGRAHQQRAARALPARARRSLRRLAHPDPSAQCRLSAGARGGARASAPASAPCWWSRRARPPTSRTSINVELRRADIQTRVLGKGCLPSTGEYISEALLKGLAAFFDETRPAGIDADGDRGPRAKQMLAHKAGADGGGRRYPGAAAELLHRLPGAAGLHRHQADAARARADPHQRRHRLPFVRDLRAVQPRQFHPRLRHVAGERRRRRPQHGAPPDRDHGRRRILAQRTDHRRRLEPVQQGRRRADRHAERLRLRHRPAISAVERGEPQRRPRPA